ncbi:MAG: cellulase-like family protein [Phormidesmis sp.]
MALPDVGQKAPESQAFYSSLVVEHIVAKTQGAAFERWQDTLAQTAQRHAGFVRLDRCPPLLCEDDVAKWYSIVHFDSPQHLNAWVESKAREQVIESGQKIIRAYRFKSFTTGLEGWFSRQVAGSEQTGLGPPAWKQVLSVVFGLYPIVMIRIKLFPDTGIISDWSPSGAMLLATLVTSAILGVVVMPFVVTRLLGFWLYPAYRDTTVKADILGFVIVALGLICMSVIFDSL